MSVPTAFTAPVSLTTRTSVTPPLARTPLHAPAKPDAPSTTVAPRRAVNLSMAFSSIDGVLTPAPTALPSDLSVVIQAIYVQVLGNAHVMESERAELRSAESEFIRSGDVREFVRNIALSETYKTRYFYDVSQYRFIELAFKHILARAPGSRAEYADVMGVYHQSGYEACISWFIDSLEYNENFGSQIVPYGIYKGCYSSNEVFNRSVAMRLAPGSSDKGRSAMLQYCVLSGDSPSWLSISKALPAGTEKGTGFTIGGRYFSAKSNPNAPVRVGTRVPGGIVFY